MSIVPGMNEWRLTGVCGNFVVDLRATEGLKAVLARLGTRRVAVVTDPDVWSQHGGTLRAALGGVNYALALAPESDAGKTLHYVADVANQLEPSRPQAVVAFGGGVAMNVAGVLAALLYRGIPLVHVPTTLVGMVDVAPSVRQFVNTRLLRGGLGLFYEPSNVLCEVCFLNTLSGRAIRDGYVEAVKAALVAPGARHLIDIVSFTTSVVSSADDWIGFVRDAVVAKVAAMRGDPREQRDGLCLHYGHTLGLALESLVSGISHGEAVLIGMDFAARLSHTLGLLDDDGYTKHRWALCSLFRDFPSFEWPPVELVLEKLKYDPKSVFLTETSHDRGIPFILLAGPGRPHSEDGMPVYSVPVDIVRDSLLQTMRRWALGGQGHA